MGTLVGRILFLALNYSIVMPNQFVSQILLKQVYWDSNPDHLYEIVNSHSTNLDLMIWQYEVCKSLILNIQTYYAYMNIVVQDYYIN